MTSWNFLGGLKYILRSFITSVVFCCIAEPCFKGGHHSCAKPVFLTLPLQNGHLQDDEGQGYFWSYSQDPDSERWVGDRPMPLYQLSKIQCSSHGKENSRSCPRNQACVFHILRPLSKLQN